MRKPTGYVIYRGPSMLDRSPVVAVALTHSRNRKTGDMVQTYILVDGVDPITAARTGQDVAVCGDCKHRPFNGGACYVTLMHGPANVYRALQRDNYPVASLVSGVTVRSLGAGRMVRLGTYGDPAAVPLEVWHHLVSQADGHTGYTHQWANTKLPKASRQRLSALVMASADTAAEAAQARAAGQRFFRIRTADEPLLENEIVCPASAEAGKRKTCATCKACSGSSRSGQASVAIIVHGAKANRFVAQRAQ